MPNDARGTSTMNPPPALTRQSDRSVTLDGDVISEHIVDIALLPRERWWGGSTTDGVSMPFGATEFARDLNGPSSFTDGLGTPSNQASSALVSTAGRAIGSCHPFRFNITKGRMRVEGRGLRLILGGTTLRDGYLAAAREFFPASGQTPARALFAAPQYNTWIDQPYVPTQDSVLRYAEELLASGMPPGVLYIDDSWGPDYGTWRFDKARFPDPAAMVTRLHDLGFSVMLWVVPFVSPDSFSFRELEKRGLLVRNRTGDTAVRRWWNGLSAVLDLSNDAAIRWITDQLDAIMDEIGVDGFKFDGGDVRDFHHDDITAGDLEPVQMCHAWSRVGLRYPFNEFRASWNMGGQALGQRLQDKPPAWDETGIGSLIPEMLAQGMAGYAFTCPDMIGGGEIDAMSELSGIDQEFFVRYAQLAALAPMAQFSVVPSRVLDAEHLDAVRESMRIRAEHTPLILDLVDQAARTGEPVVRPMAYHAPELIDVTDQFFLGADVVVAPVLQRGATERRVQLPAGSWRGTDDRIVTGPVEVAVTCGLRTLPIFERVTQEA
ncbi:glycoside hydrolase family 31 protein [Streptomyces sp. NPDC053750]|uniref:glycoside hydrolase family 31 protein n=1 Tax=Streptomyces sp. NPDC053750 TaxID=3365714 RepID=UPI0037D8DF95